MMSMLSSPDLTLYPLIRTSLPTTTTIRFPLASPRHHRNSPSPPTIAQQQHPHSNTPVCTISLQQHRYAAT
jgi:hypothetical protein